MMVALSQRIGASGEAKPGGVMSLGSLKVCQSRVTTRET